MSEPFTTRLIDAQVAKNTTLCVGLDPDVTRIPQVLREDSSDQQAILEFCSTIIEHTSPFACAYKLNFAFFESLGASGWRLIASILEIIPDDCLVIADAKRGDIGNTAAMYAKSVFDTMSFDACTVSPYMGGDSVKPFLSYPSKGVFVLVLTSNASANDFQQKKVGRNSLYELVAEQSTQWGKSEPGEIGFVIGATKPETLVDLRQQFPTVPFLVPGVGAQGGSAEKVMLAATDAGRVIVNSSRGIIYASAGADFGEAAGAAAKDLASQLRVR